MSDEPNSESEKMTPALVPWLTKEMMEGMSQEEIDSLSQINLTFLEEGPKYTFVEPEPDEFFDALSSPSTTPEEIERLIQHGANPNAVRAAGYEREQHALGVAVKAGNPEIVEVLLRNGSNASYTNESGYTILVQACYGDQVKTNPGLVSILAQLLDRGADIDAGSKYGETPIRVLTRMNRYDAVGFLLTRGASTRSIEWSPLHHAVALGTIADIDRLVKEGAELAALDWQDRTPAMVALQIGDIEKAKHLVELGANFDTTLGAKVKPFECAVESLDPEVLHYYLGLGYEFVPNSISSHGPLRTAMDYGNPAMVKIVFDYYKDSPEIQQSLNEALHDDDEGIYVKWLLDLGASSGQVQPSARRVVLGHSDHGFPRDFPREKYEEQKRPRLGSSNPEEAHCEFWLEMIFSRASAYHARMAFDDEPVFACGPDNDPVWCANRFGQTFTSLPDGRIVEIAGEHEDSYDPDFCIYNDVFVHHPDGSTQIFTYPKEVFPPTDFHTATVVGDWIYIIGSLGYPDARQGNAISVFRLNTIDYSIEKVETHNSVGFQLYEQDAHLQENRIILKNGMRIRGAGEDQKIEPNTETVALDLKTLSWSIED